MSGPDVRWEGVSHLQIAAWAVAGRGAQVTERLEGHLKTVAETLTQTSDLVNATLQRLNAGEWTGNAATVAAQAMQVVRDFDESMGHHSKMGGLAAFGQSDSASWVKASVPPVGRVDPPTPNGTLTDMVKATEDHYEQLQAARDAEEEARRVMRGYETMTRDRVAGMPPLTPAPRVVVADGPDTIIVPPGGPGPGTDSRNDYVPPRGEDTVDDTVMPRPGGTPTAEVPDSGLPSGAPSGPSGSPSGLPAATNPAAVTDTRPPVASPVGDTQRPNAPGPGGYSGFLAGDGSRGPLRGSAGPLRGNVGQRGGESGARGSLSRARATETRTGMAPVGAGRGQSDEDKEHQVKYGVAGADIFEPDHDDGLLHDPYRPGSFVAPATIGDDEDE